MVPIMIELQNRGIHYNYIDSGQHAELTKELRKIFQIAEPDYLLNSDHKDITKISIAILWFVKNIVKSVLDRKWLRRDVFPDNGLCLIHGDTLSTLLGALMAIFSGSRLCHVEAGLRSFNWLDPFPEEIIRLICMRFSSILFAPSEKALNNLISLRVKGDKYAISGNTVIDSIRFIERRYISKNEIKEKYAVATCHRLETISNRTKLKNVIELINRISKEMPVVFVIHKPTLKYINKFGLSKIISENIKIKDMMSYPHFLSLVAMSEMVLTDGGSIQEECSYLNKKCLIIRNSTERRDGLNKNAMLWKFDKLRSEEFIKWRIENNANRFANISPSKEIVDHLVRVS